MIRDEVHIWQDGAVRCIGRLVWDDAADGPRPAVLIAPAFWGLGDFEAARARDLAGLGYVALAVDLYGEGRKTEDAAEASALMRGLAADRRALARRMQVALDAASALPQVDAARIGAMGYCFGGKCVLDLARSGAGLRAAVSIHGLYDPPPGPRRAMQAAALILHGWDDPLAPPEAVEGLAAELTETCPDWQILAFGHTGHAFTNPKADDRAEGLFYQPTAAARSWRAVTGFFEEILR